MTIYEATAAKIRQLPESEVKEICDFIDFLCFRHNENSWQARSLFKDEPKNLLDREEKKLRILELAGKYNSGLSDVSARHDDYLVEAYAATMREFSSINKRW